MRLRELIMAVEHSEFPEIPNVIEDGGPVELALVVSERASERIIMSVATRALAEHGNIPIVNNAPVEVEVEVPIEVEVPVEVEKIVERVNPADAEMKAEIKELKAELAKTRRALTISEKKVDELEQLLKTPADSE